MNLARETALVMGHPETYSTNGLHRRKRLKISLACEECRARKVRCDGVRPQCSACSRKPSGQACRYPQETSRSSGSEKRQVLLSWIHSQITDQASSLLQTLHDRLVQLEGRMSQDSAPKSLPEQSTPDNNGSVSEHMSSIEVDLAGDFTPMMPANVCNGQHLSSVGNQSAVPIALDRNDAKQTPSSIRLMNHEEEKHCKAQGPEDVGSISAMGVAQSRPDEATSTSSDFYGNSSVASLFSHIHERLPHSESPRARKEKPSRKPFGLHRISASVTSLTSPDDFHLPPRHIADHLMNLYYQRVHLLYPYLHWPTLMEAFRRLWLSDAELDSCEQLEGVGLGGPECSASVFYCALNAIFALGMQFADIAADQRGEMARPFCRRARHLLRLDYLDHGDLALVQALLIMAHYLQGTNLPSRCWSISGVAYRMAQGLGLHLEIDESVGSPLFREIRRRVWHGCVCLDTSLGMTLGRPCLGSMRSSVGLPKPLPEETLDGENSIDSDITTTVLFFAETTRLYQILERILSQVYDPWKAHEACRSSDSSNSSTDQAGQISRVVGLDTDLDQFANKVPELLRWTATVPILDGRSSLHRQRNVLRTRFLHTRILLYRPLLVQLCQKNKSQAEEPSRWEDFGLSMNEPKLFWLLARRCSLSCVENAQTLIEHINATSRTVDTGAPWFNSYYLYHAAMVLALAEFCEPILQELDRDRLACSWRQCEDFLERMIEHDSESYRFLRILRDISTYFKTSSSLDGAGIERAGQGNSSQNEKQGQIVNHLTNPLLDPSMAAWIDDSPRFNMIPQFGEGDFGLELFRDQSWTLAGGGITETLPMMGQEWGGPW